MAIKVLSQGCIYLITDTVNTITIKTFISMTAKLNFQTPLLQIHQKSSHYANLVIVFEKRILIVGYLHSANFIPAHFIQILHFQHHSGVHPGGKGKSSDNNPSTICVSKIQSFTCLGERWKNKKVIILLMVNNKYLLY